MNLIRSSLICLYLTLACQGIAESTADEGATPLPGGRLSPDTLIRNFSLPGFNEAGYRQWQLTGDEGVFIDDAVVHINQLKLRFYSGDENGNLHSILESPEALVEADRGRAISEASIELKGPDFKVQGVGWIWQGKQQTILIRSNVAVTFSQSLRYILE